MKSSVVDVTLNMVRSAETAMVSWREETSMKSPSPMGIGRLMCWYTDMRVSGWTKGIWVRMAKPLSVRTMEAGRLRRS